MADKLIGSLIYGDHEQPKKYRPWKERLKVPLALAAVLLVAGGVLYTFANYREERRVSQFLDDVQAGRYEAAYGRWDIDGHYTMDEFLADWGKDGYYTKGSGGRGRVIASKGSGLSVTVYVEVDSSKRPVAIRVEKENLKLSFSPSNEYMSWSDWFQRIRQPSSQ